MPKFANFKKTTIVDLYVDVKIDRQLSLGEQGNIGIFHLKKLESQSDSGLLWCG